MGFASTVKGPCSSEGCRRRGKVQYECVKCDKPMRGCGMHRNRVLEQMKRHLDTEHAEAVERETEKHYGAIEREEKIAASPTLQKIETGKRLTAAILTVAAVIALLWLLTWLKMHHR